MRRTAMAIAGCMLLACGAPGGVVPVSESDASSASALEPYESSAAEVSVCHRADERWVPIRVAEAAVKSHVGKHGDFVYDASAGQCCTDADCAAGLACRHSVGADGENLVGTCPMAGGGTTDPIAFLLSMGLFGAADGTTPPILGTLSRDAAGLYSFSFTLNGIIAQVPLATFVPGDTTLGENTQEAVTVTFPARSTGLITFRSDLSSSYLTLHFTDYSSQSLLPAVGTVNLINATVAGFNFDIDSSNPDSWPVVYLDSGASYSILGIRGVYVQPTSYIGDGTGPAGFYLYLLNGSTTAHVLVFREAAYDVRL